VAGFYVFCFVPAAFRQWYCSTTEGQPTAYMVSGTEALSLAQRFGDVVWDIVFSELQQPQGAHQTPDWMTTTEAGGNKMDPWEEERSWRDPSHIDSAVLQ
jgi:hypothetical protein